MIRQIQTRDKIDALSSKQLVTLSSPASAAAEAYRTVRTNLLHNALLNSPGSVVALMSSGPHKDRSAVCANLGVALAQAGKKTLIVDCDLRHPVLHEAFGLDNPSGVADIVAEEQGLEETWQEPLPGLKVITGGPSPLDPTELLESERFANFLDQVRRDFDHVLIEAPPLDGVSDAAILAAQSDGVLLVLDYRKTRKKNVQLVMRSLHAVRANVLGTVLTNVRGAKSA